MLRLTLLFILLSMKCCFLSATIEIRSMHFTMSDGIANNSVRYVFQDSKGFIWLGTLNGLSRYDGNSFVNYYPEEGVPSLVDHRVQRMYEDCDGLIWVKVVSERLCCYDTRRGRFVDFTGCGEYGQPYSEAKRASNGDIWMWHERNGCRRVRYRDGVFSSVTFRKADGTLSSVCATGVIEDARGRIWVTTDGGVDLVEGDKAVHVADMSSPVGLRLGEHLFFISADGRIFMEQERTLKEVGRLPAASAGAVSGIMPLQDDLYVFTSEGGYVYQTATRRVTRAVKLDIRNAEVQKDNRGNYWIYNNTGRLYYVDASDRTVKSLCLLSEDKMQYIDFERFCFVHDSRDIIWISTYGNGLFAYDLHTGELQHFTAPANGYGQIPSNYLLYVMEDRSGGIWISAEYSGVARLSVLNEGVNYLYPNGWGVMDDRSNFVRMLTRLEDGRIYVGTRRGGMYVYDARMELLEHKDFHSNIYAVAKDAEGRLWMGSRGEGLCVDGTWYKHRDNRPSSLASDHIFCLHRDRKGRMWVGTFNGGLDLAVAERGRYVFAHFLNHTYNQRQVRAICEDGNGYMWVGTSDGVYLFQPDSLIAAPNSYRRFDSQNCNLGSNVVKGFCVDRQGRIWMATSGGGLVMCRPGKDYDHLVFERYDDSRGLVDNMVQAVVEDHQGRIWASTEYGISCLDVDKEVFGNYFFSSRTLGNTYSDNSGCVMEDGRIAFGSAHGLAVISPAKVWSPAPSLTPHVSLTGLKINGITVQPGETDSPLDKAMAYTTAIDLAHHQNSFEVDFSMLDNLGDGMVKYTYKLDNYDKDWSAPSAQHFAVYKNLAPGHYRLRVKACNALGIWGERETTLDIDVHPSFWQSRWAYLIYALLFVGIGYFLFRTLQKFNMLRTRIEVERQLTEYKLVFFTNISHEFRTPLTLIQGALEKIEGCVVPGDMAYSLKIINKNAKRMLRLVNQLLEFRKMQNNKLSLSLEEMDVVAFLYEIFLSFKDAAESKKMDFRFVSSVEAYRMFIDKENLDKVSYNLLSNAFKYTPTGGRIVFSVMVDGAAKRLVVSVSDTGVGIPPEKQGELFKRFMQSSFSGNSIGVGLHLTHELVCVHKGTIVYAENPGGGSLFTVSLPTDVSVYEEKDFLIPNQLLVEEEQQRPKEQAEVRELTAEEQVLLNTVSLNKRKILVIEDDDDVREFLRQEIGHYFEVVVEADGVSGLERARTYDADLIVCDVLMPGLTGFEVTRRLKNNFNTSHIPIILLTALGAEDKQLEGVKSGADAYIVKPFSRKMLLMRIVKLIEQRDRLRERFSDDPQMKHPVICTSQQDKEFAERLQRLMEKQIGNSQFTVDEFAEQMKMGRTIFYRKVRGVTGYTPSEYMRIMRLKKSVELMANGYYNIAEISYRVGMNDPFYFSKCFKQQFGVAPTAYQKGERADGTVQGDGDDE